MASTGTVPLEKALTGAVQCQICMEYDPHLNDPRRLSCSHVGYCVNIVFLSFLKSLLSPSHVLHAGL